jgi:hypothetical protein
MVIDGYEICFYALGAKVPAETSSVSLVVFGKETQWIDRMSV